MQCGQLHQSSHPIAAAIALTLHFSAGRNVRADDPLLSTLEVKERLQSATGKAFLTVNRFGFETASLDSNWAIEAFQSSIQPGSIMLDIGAGYGALSRAALERGASVISNDLALDHLLWTRSQIAPKNWEHLCLNTARFPDLTIRTQSLTHISAHRIFHFLSGPELQQGLQNCFAWLQPGGMLMAVAMSATHARFRDAFYPEYQKRQQEGVRWPGECLDVTTHLQEQAYNLPPHLHVFTPEQLKEEVSKVGFRVERADYISLARFGRDSDGRDGREAVGFVARKP